MDEGVSAETFATESVATVNSETGASMTASSSNSPAQRCRTSRCVWPPSGVTSVQLAAIGSPVLAPRCASTSLPRSVPAASTAVAPVSVASPASVRAQACGAYASRELDSMRYTSVTPYRARVSRGAVSAKTTALTSLIDRARADGP